VQSSHGALDGGLGYTYFDQKAGHEFSAVAGLTGNFENPATDYTNGIDFHLDLAASQFLTKQLQVGVVGYVYDQRTTYRYAQLGRVRQQRRLRNAWVGGSNPFRAPDFKALSIC
jgi:hypothetical protein